MKRRNLYKFCYHVLRGAVSQVFRPARRLQRNENVVDDTYSFNYTRETNNDFMFKRQDVFINGTRAVYPVIEYKKIILQKFAGKLSVFYPESILELGSGRGFNVLTLAVLLPQVKRLRGIELSENGVNQAKANFKNPPTNILCRLSGVSKTEVLKRLQGRDIDFIRGSILELPFKDNEFDAMFSNSVIEQIPRDCGRVFTESFRVAKKASIFNEPFYEAQRFNIFKLMYLRNIDYFRASYDDVSESGWNIYQFEIPEIQKFVFSTGILTCIKNIASLDCE